MGTKNSSFTPHLVVDLKPHLEDYLRKEMNCPEGPIFISRTSDIGRWINAHCQSCAIPAKKVFRKNPVEIVLPVTENNKTMLNCKFLFITKWGEEKIQDYIEAESKLRFKLMFEIGYRKGYSQKQIIEAILQAYNIRNTKLSFDQIKKSDYRHERKVRELIYRDLQSAVY